MRRRPASSDDGGQGRTLLKEKLTGIDEVASIESSFALNQVKYTDHLLL